MRSWKRAPVWADERVDGDNLLLIRDPGPLNGRRVVVRSTTARRTGLARVEQSSVGSEAHVHPSLARRLGATDRKFEAEWRQARWYDVLVHGDRTAFLMSALTAIAAIVVAAIAFENNKSKFGGLAIAALVVAVLLAFLKARSDWKKLIP